MLCGFLCRGRSHEPQRIPSVHLPDELFDATVGHALFEHSVLSLDFHDMRLWMTQES